MYIYLNGIFYGMNGARISIDDPIIKNVLNRVIKHIVSRDGYIKDIVLMGKQGIKITFADTSALDIYSLNQVRLELGDLVDINFDVQSRALTVAIKQKQENEDSVKSETNMQKEEMENTDIQESTIEEERELPVYEFDFTKQKVYKNPDIQIPCIIKAQFDENVYSHILVIYKDKSRDAINSPDDVLEITKPIKKLTAVKAKHKE